MRMLHFAEPSQNIGSIRPIAKQIFDRFYDVAQFWKIAIMQTQAPNSPAKLLPRKKRRRQTSRKKIEL